jgi:hypothetical protein
MHNFWRVIRLEITVKTEHKAELSKSETFDEVEADFGKSASSSKRHDLTTFVRRTKKEHAASRQMREGTSSSAAAGIPTRGEETKDLGSPKSEADPSAD